MKKKLITLIIMAFALAAHAQIIFQKTYGGPNFDYGNCVRQTTDGGYIIAGSTESFGADSSDVYLIKTNSYGDTLWTKTYGGVNVDDGSSATQTSDGGYIIGGTTNSFGAGNKDIFLTKTDSTGNLIWSKTFGGSADEYFGANIYGGESCLNQTSDGGYVIAGTTESFGAGSSDIYLIKTNALGDTLWTKTFGGVDEEFGYAVQQTTDGGYIISGSTLSFISFFRQVFLLKTDSTGTLTWTQSIGVAYGEEGFSVQQTTDGGYVVAGYISGFTGGRIICLFRFDSNGNVLWVNSYGGIEGDCVRQTADGGFIICGLTSGSSLNDIALIKTDGTGAVQWSKSFGGPTYFDGSLSVRQTTDNGFIIAGETQSFGEGNGDVYLIKTDSLGNSGCNQANVPTFPILHTETVIPHTPVTVSGGIIMTPSFSVSSGAAVGTLCLMTEVPTPTLSLQKSVFSIFPNPVINTASISFSLIQSQNISMKIFDVSGRLLSTLAEKIFEAGENKLVWSAADVNVGIYFLQFQSAENLQTEKLLVTK